MSAEQDKSKSDFYKESVFLPKTDFPMRGGLPKKEPEILKKWQDMDLYKKLREASKGREKWILHDGPPYANGHIHMGHAMNKILKDVINRSWQMLGYDAPYIPGWDCHGLPIEWKVEEQYREKGKDKDEIDALTFRAECRDFAQKWVDVQSEDFQRLGVIGDWDTPYLTMTHQAEAQIVREIHKFLLNGGLYKGVKPVMWSTVEKTALAEAEIEYKEHKSITIWVRFPIIETNFDLVKDANVVIWTTTPWTMPSNRAVAYGEHIEYAVYTIKAVEDVSQVKVGDKLVLATSLAEDVKANCKIADWEASEAFSGKALEGTVCAHPLRGQGYDFDVRALPADFVTEDAGTGFVHIAPGHGADDFVLGMKHGVEVTDNVTDDGKFRDHVPLFAGLTIYDEKGKMGDGNFAPLKAMTEVGALLGKGSVRHEYPHSWRSKAPVIFRTTPQWFIAMDNDLGLRDKSLAAIKETRWVPAQGEKRISSMIEQRPDWCISRQRAWGVPIALFVHKETGEPLKDEAVLTRIAEAFEAEGADAWWAKEAADFLGTEYKAEDYVQVFDIVDVWFESGSTHSFVVDAREELAQKADLYLEGSDQHRGWFHSSLLESCGTKGDAPFKTVLTHGFVLDEKGYKMSKSLGNVVDPLKILEQSGADIMRLWTMTADYAEDIRIGKDVLKSSADLYRRIRNTFRFLLGSLKDFSDTEKLDDSEYKNMPELEQLVLHWLAEMDRDVRRHIEEYDYGQLANKLHLFCNNDLSAFYFDIRKDRLYCDAPDSFERRACRTVLYHVFDCLSAWMAPILSFTAEEVWSHRPEGLFEGVESVHLRTFPKTPDHWMNNALAEKWQKIREIRRGVLGTIEPKRASKEIRSSLEAKILLSGNKDLLDNVDMAEICVVSQCEILEGSADAPCIVETAKGHKCQRCWKILPDVEEGGICDRCAAVIKKQEAA